MDLPIYLKKQKKPLLINLDAGGTPLFYRNTIVTLHDIVPVRFPQSCSRKFCVLWQLTYPVILNNASSLVTVSNFSKEEISDYFKRLHKDIHVIYNAVGEKFREDNSRNKTLSPYLLSVSTQAYHKNFGRLIEALDGLYKSGKLEIPLVVAGGPSPWTKGKYNSSHNAAIRFVGRVTDEELVRLYQGATAFVFPSLYEGFGIPPLEAQACGCPVIASKATAMPEVLGNSAFYFDPNDVSDMQEAICKVVQDSSLRADLIKKGTENVHRFSWDVSARRLYEIILPLR
jgi:glycosyltransferase involved in cell wall biosynthesis